MNKPVSGLWTAQEAWDFLDTYHYHMDKMEPYDQAVLVENLMEMAHRPHCRFHMSGIAPEYGADCTCDAKYRMGSWLNTK